MGIYGKKPLLSIVDKKTFRILELPVGDYTGETIREVLEALLNDGAFQGSIPDGSGQRYVVEGSNTEVRIKFGERAVLRRAVRRWASALFSR